MCVLIDSKLFAWVRSGGRGRAVCADEFRLCFEFIVFHVVVFLRLRACVRRLVRAHSTVLRATAMNERTGGKWTVRRCGGATVPGLLQNVDYFIGGYCRLYEFSFSTDYWRENEINGRD